MELLHIKSRIYTLLTFLLLTVYHLFIRHNIFKDCIDRNVLNLGYEGGGGGGESRYILVVGMASHIAAGEVQLRKLKRWRTLWSLFTRDPEWTFKSVWNSNWHDFLFCLREDFIVLSIQNNCFWFWDDSFGGEKASEVVIKGTSFVKMFWKFKYTYSLAALVFVFIA